MLLRFCSAVRLLLLVVLCGALPASLRSQDAPADGSAQVFKANAQIVVLDVVVTGKNEALVPGLRKEDFQVSEDGHPQTITHFEEHTGSPQNIPAPLPPLPPNVFSNIPRTKPGDSVTVLLLDFLNTQLTDQSRVRLQTLSFLKTLKPGQRMAIFGLNSQLRFIQGFTDDPAVLAAAIDRKGNGAKLKVSPLLVANSETEMSVQTAGVMRSIRGGEGYDAAAALEQMMADQSSDRGDARLKLTLEAFQELAHYLGGIPGRKNIAWFSGGFPVLLSPDFSVREASGPQRDEQEEVRRTDALLASAQVSIYPISAEGVSTGSFYTADPNGWMNQQQIAAVRQNEANDRNSAHTAMDEIAKYTGGKAFYNTNGLKEALASVTNNGSHYYTITYSSPNQATDGRYRKIQLKLNPPGYQLAYRQGYYADDAKSRQKAAKSAPADPLVPLMRPGLPVSTQIPLTVSVLRNSDQPPAANLAQGGDTHNPTGPLTSYTVHFFIPPGGLLLDLAPNGQRALSVEAALMVYDQSGKSLNQMIRKIDLDMDAAHYATAVANGVNFRLQIAAPAEGISLRSGVYDLQSNLAGTLEVPLNTLVNPSPAPGSR